MKNLWRVVGTVAVWAGVVGVGAGQTVGTSASPAAPDNQASGTKRAMTFQDLMALKRVSDPQVSPSGKWVLFSVTDVSLEKNTKVNHLWVVGLGATAGPSTTTAQGAVSAQDDTSKSSGERQVTFGDGESNGRFSPDGKWVSYSAKDQIYVAPWDEAAGAVGAGKQLTSVSTGADGGEWSPDSKRLMFVADVYPECSVKGGADQRQRHIPSENDRQVGASDGSAGPSTTAGAPPTAQDDGALGGVVVGGTRDLAAWKGAEPAGWAEEEACDKAKDDAAAKTPVKGQVWEGLLYRHWDHYLGAKRSHVLVVSADATGVRDLTPASAVGDAETPTFSLGGPLGYAWAPDGKEIAYVANLDKVPAASTNNDVFTLRLDDPGAKAVKVSTSPGSDDGPAYSPDGKWLAFRSQARNGFESDKFRLMVMDRETKTIKELMPKFDDWVDEFVWAPDSKAIYFASGDVGTEPVFRADLESNKVDRLDPGEIGPSMSLGFRAEFGSLMISPNGKTMVATGTSVWHPADLYKLDLSAIQYSTSPTPEENARLMRKGRQTAEVDRELLIDARPVSHLNDQLIDGLELHRNDMERFWFTGAEGTKVEGFMLKPPGFDPAKKYPVKFLMHGGPQTAWGDAWSYRWNWELMAASGYVVVGINRRGSTGYGQKFVDEVSGDWGGRAYEDLMKGLDYAEAHYPFMDKTRECALGASYGGYMADWVLTHTDRFKCVVTHDGMYDPVSAWGDTEEMWFNEWEFRRPEDYPKGWDGFGAGYDPMGATPPKRSLDGAPASVGGHAAEPWRYQDLPADQDPFRKWSPMRFIENAKTPTLVIHSQRDMRLDVSQGMELFTALQRRGVPSKMMYFPDEGHWILKPQNSQLWNEVVGDWCDRWTHSGKYAETGDREQGTGNRERGSGNREQGTGK